MCVTPLFFFLWGGKKQLTTGTLAGAIYTYRSLFWVTPFALVALLSSTSSEHFLMPPLAAKWLPGPRPRL